MVLGAALKWHLWGVPATALKRVKLESTDLRLQQVWCKTLKLLGDWDPSSQSPVRFGYQHRNKMLLQG